MKKHLFFAFAAAAVLASCSSHDDFDNYSAGTPQAPVDDNSPQEILLGVGAQANVATRGTGTVGGDHNMITTNHWYNQRINVYMFNKYKYEVDGGNPTTQYFTLAKETENGPEIYKNAVFMAPDDDDSGPARHIDDLTATTNDYKRSYYPMNGNFDFWAYRLDDAIYRYDSTYNNTFATPLEAENAGYVAYTNEEGKAMFSDGEVNGAETASGDWVPENDLLDETYKQVYVKTTKKQIEGPDVKTGNINDAKITVPFIIDGSQDVMAASTYLTDEDSVNLNNGVTLSGTDWYRKAATFKNYARSLYSAKTARKNVQPNLKFRHLLTRFTFDAMQMKDATNTESEPVRIKEIMVKSKTNGQIVAKYKYLNQDKLQDATDSVPELLDCVIDNKMEATGVAKKFLHLKKRTTGASENDSLVALTDGTQVYEYIILEGGADVVEKGTGTGTYYQVGEKVAEADLGKLTSEGEGTLYEKKIWSEGIALNTSDYEEIGEALLVMPDEEVYEMDITVEQTVYGREDAAGNGVESSKEVKTQTIKGLKIKASEVLSGSHPEASEQNPTPTDGNKVGLKTFAAGNSYNVRVQVYGLTKIEVQTTLEPWENGGHIDLDPDSQF